MKYNNDSQNRTGTVNSEEVAFLRKKNGSTLGEAALGDA